MTLPVLQVTGEEKQHRQLIAGTINEMLKGRANNAGSFTLAAGATTTTVIDPAFESVMVPIPVATTATAAAAMTVLRVTTRSNGSFVLTHNNTADVDRTFLYVRMG